MPISADTVPARLPSMEPICDLVRQVVAAQYADALAAVAARYATPSVPLRVPVQVTVQGANQYVLPQQWPALVIAGPDARVEQANEQLGSQLWRGRVELTLWEAHDDPEVLTRVLHRHAAALWLLLTANDPLGGYAALDYRSQEIGEVEVTASVNVRGVMVAADVWFTT